MLASAFFSGLNVTEVALAVTVIAVWWQKHKKHEEMIDKKNKRKKNEDHLPPDERDSILYERALKKEDQQNSSWTNPTWSRMILQGFCAITLAGVAQQGSINFFEDRADIFRQDSVNLYSVPSYNKTTNAVNVPYTTNENGDDLECKIESLRTITADQPYGEKQPLGLFLSWELKVKSVFEDSWADKNTNFKEHIGYTIVQVNGVNVSNKIDFNKAKKAAAQENVFFTIALMELSSSKHATSPNANSFLQMDSKGKQKRDSFLQMDSNVSGRFLNMFGMDAVDDSEDWFSIVTDPFREHHGSNFKTVKNETSKIISDAKRILKRTDIDVNQTDEDGCTALILFSKQGNLPMIREILKRTDILVDKGDNNGLTPLMWGCCDGRFKVVQELLKCEQVDVNQINRVRTEHVSHFRNSKSKGMTALIFAARAGQTEILQELLKHSEIDVNKSDVKKQTALMHGAKKGFVNVVKAILKHSDSDVNETDHQNMTALMHGSKKGHAAVVTQILKHPDMDVNQLNQDNMSAVYLAVDGGHLTVTKELMNRQDIELTWNELLHASMNDDVTRVQELINRNDCDVNGCDKYGITALMLACSFGHMSIVKELLKHPSIDVDRGNHLRGKTALMCATNSGHIEVVKEILKRFDIDVNTPDFRGNPALSYTSVAGHFDVLKELLTRTDIDVNRSVDRTALELAAEHGHANIVREFLNHPEIDINNPAVLLRASEVGNIDVVKIILDHPDVDVNQVNETGYTALVLAGRYGYVDVVREILKNPAVDVNHLDRHDLTAIRWSYNFGRTLVVKELLQHPSIDVDWTDLMRSSVNGEGSAVQKFFQTNVYTNKVDKVGNTALSLAASVGQASVVKEILQDVNVDVNVVNYEARTALKVVGGDRNPVETAEEFLKRDDVDVNKLDCEGETSLHWFANGGQVDAIKALLKRADMNVNQLTDQGESALSIACKKGLVYVVKELLKHPTIDIHNPPALVIASRSGNINIVRELLKHPTVDVNESDKAGYTALVNACKSGDLRLVKEILQHADIDINQDVDGIGEYGWGAFRWTIIYRHASIMKALLNHPKLDQALTDLMRVSILGDHLAVRDLMQNPDIDVNENDKYGLTALHYGCSFDHVDVVRELLKHEDIQVDVKDEVGMTALLSAVYPGGDDSTNRFLGHLEIVKQLLMRVDCDVNLADRNQTTALIFAAETNRIDIVKEILKRSDVDASRPKWNGDTALHAASAKGHVDVVRELLKRSDVDVNQYNLKQASALSKAFDGGHLRVVAELLKHPEIDVIDPPALTNACLTGSTRIVKEVLKHQAVNINQTGWGGKTALIRGSGLSRYMDVMKILLQRPDLDVNKMDNSGRTAMASAVHNCNLPVVKELLKRDDLQSDWIDLMRNSILGNVEAVQEILSRSDVDANEADKKGLNALMLSSSFGHVGVVQALVKHPGININQQNSEGWSALMYAAPNGDVPVVRELLRHRDINVNLGDKDECTALVWTGSSGPIGTGQELLKRTDIDVNKAKAGGETVLIRATQNDNGPFVIELLKHPQLKINKKTDDGDTALSIACRKGYANLVTEFLKHSDIDITDPPALLSGCRCGNASVVRTILQQPGVDVNEADENGWTALMLVRDDLKTAQAILAHPGIDVNRKNNSSYTAADVHWHDGNFPVLKALLTRDDIEVSRAPLMDALLRNDAIAVKELVQRPEVDVNQSDKDNNTALMCGCKNHEKIKCVTELLRHADINLDHVNSKNETALIVASQSGLDLCVEEILQCAERKSTREDCVVKFRYKIHSPQEDTEASVTVTVNSDQTMVADFSKNAVQNSGRTHIALKNKGYEMMSTHTDDNEEKQIVWRCRTSVSAFEADGSPPTELIWHDVGKVVYKDPVKWIKTTGKSTSYFDVNIADNESATALWWASAWGHTEVAKALLKHPHINVNQKGRCGDDPLGIAGWGGHYNVLKELLDHDDIDVNQKNDLGRTPLITIGLGGHSLCFNHLVQHENIDINEADNDGQTVLTMAAVEGYVKIVKEVLQHPNVLVNHKNNKGESALHQACWAGHVSVVRHILDHPEVKPNLVDENGNTALSIACDEKYLSIVEEFFIREAVDASWTTLMKKSVLNDLTGVRELVARPEVDVNAAANLGETALLLASLMDHVGVVKEILTREDMDVNKPQDENGKTALICACENGHLEVVMELLKRRDIGVNKVGKEDCDSALVCAVKGKHLSVVKALLKHSDINVNLPSASNGMTPLMWAALEGLTSIATQLLQHPDSDINAVDRFGRAVLIHAASASHFNVCEEILEHPNVDVNVRTNQDATALIHAAYFGSTLIVKRLLQRQDILVNTRANFGGTALMLASGRGHHGVVKELLLHPDIDVTMFQPGSGKNAFLSSDNINVFKEFMARSDANINQAEHFKKNTLLGLQAKNGKLNYVEEILKQPNVDVNKANNEGATPLMLACQNKEYKDGVRRALLMHRDINVNLADNDGKTVLISACARQDDFFEEFLQCPDIDVNKADNGGLTALMHSSRNGYVILVKELLQHPEIDVNKTDKNGWTALMHASEQGHSGVVQCLRTHPSIDQTVHNDSRHRAVDIGRRRGHQEVVKAFQDSFSIADEIIFDYKEPEMAEFNKLDGTILHKVSANTWMVKIRKDALPEVSAEFKIQHKFLCKKGSIEVIVEEKHMALKNKKRQSRHKRFWRSICNSFLQIARSDVDGNDDGAGGVELTEKRLISLDNLERFSDNDDIIKHGGSSNVCTENAPALVHRKMNIRDGIWFSVGDHIVADVGLGLGKTVHGIVTKVLDATNQCELVTMPLNPVDHKEILQHLQSLSERNDEPQWQPSPRLSDLVLSSRRLSLAQEDAQESDDESAESNAIASIEEVWRLDQATLQNDEYVFDASSSTMYPEIRAPLMAKMQRQQHKFGILLSQRNVKLSFVKGEVVQLPHRNNLICRVVDVPEATTAATDPLFTVQFEGSKDTFVSSYSTNSDGAIHGFNEIYEHQTINRTSLFEQGTYAEGFMARLKVKQSHLKKQAFLLGSTVSIPQHTRVRKKAGGAATLSEAWKDWRWDSLSCVEETVTGIVSGHSGHPNTLAATGKFLFDEEYYLLLKCSNHNYVAVPQDQWKKLILFPFSEGDAVRLPLRKNVPCVIVSPIPEDPVSLDAIYTVEFKGSGPDYESYGLQLAETDSWDRYSASTVSLRMKVKKCDIRHAKTEVRKVRALKCTGKEPFKRTAGSLVNSQWFSQSFLGICFYGNSLELVSIERDSWAEENTKLDQYFGWNIVQVNSTEVRNLKEFRSATKRLADEHLVFTLKQISRRDDQETVQVEANEYGPALRLFYVLAHECARLNADWHAEMNIWMFVLPLVWSQILQSCMVFVLWSIVTDPDLERLDGFLTIAALMVFVYDIFTFLTGPSLRCLYCISNIEFKYHDWPVGARLLCMLFWFVDLAIALATLLMGCKFIAISESETDLLLNVVSLHFLLDIDDWIGTLMPNVGLLKDIEIPKDVVLPEAEDMKKLRAFFKRGKATTEFTVKHRETHWGIMVDKSFCIEDIKTLPGTNSPFFGKTGWTIKSISCEDNEDLSRNSLFKPFKVDVRKGEIRSRKGEWGKKKLAVHRKTGKLERSKNMSAPGDKGFLNDAIIVSVEGQSVASLFKKLDTNEDTAELAKLNTHWIQTLQNLHTMSGK